MHWTYDTIEPDSDLEQGDILAPTGPLVEVLSSVHKHFCDSKYLGFIVATQSCDLVRRPEVGAPYISIATIRSLKQVLSRLLASEIPSVAQGVFPAKEKFAAKKFLTRLLNQNEQGAGLFYLHPSAEVGLGEPAVAFLRVKVALRAEHYRVLTDARRGRLHVEYRSKFGWLLGNLYSRTAARDWSDYPNGKAQLRKLVETLLDENESIWVDDRAVNEARAKGIDLAALSPADAASEISKHKPPPVLDQVVAEVMSEVDKRLVPTPADRDFLRNKLLNSPALIRLTRTS